MNDFDLDAALAARESLVTERDAAEGARKELDEQLKPQLAIRGGRYEGSTHSATLVDRATTTYDHDTLRKSLLLAGVGMDVITAAFEQSKKVTQSTSVNARRRT